MEAFSNYGGQSVGHWDKLSSGSNLMVNSRCIVGYKHWFTKHSIYLAVVEYETI